MSISDENCTVAYDISHWQSDGIRKIHIDEVNPLPNQRVQWDCGNYRHAKSGRIGGTVFLSYTEACLAAEKMKLQRINFLKQQISKLEQFNFVNFTFVKDE